MYTRSKVVSLNLVKSMKANRNGCVATIGQNKEKSESAKKNPAVSAKILAFRFPLNCA